MPADPAARRYAGRHALPPRRRARRRPRVPGPAGVGPGGRGGRGGPAPGGPADLRVERPGPQPAPPGGGLDPQRQRRRGAAVRGRPRGPHPGHPDPGRGGGARLGGPGRRPRRPGPAGPVRRRHRRQPGRLARRVGLPGGRAGPPARRHRARRSATGSATPTAPTTPRPCWSTRAATACTWPPRRRPAAACTGPPPRSGPTRSTSCTAWPASPRWSPTAPSPPTAAPSSSATTRPPTSTRAPGRRVGSFELPLQFQGESITVTADGRSVLAGSEGPESEVWRVPLPESALARVTPTTRPPPAASAPANPRSAGSGSDAVPGRGRRPAPGDRGRLGRRDLAAVPSACGQPH